MPESHATRTPGSEDRRELASELLAAFGSLMSKRGGSNPSPARRAEHRGLWLLLDDADSGGCGLRVVDLCERLGVKPPTVTRAVDALERRGLVSRTADVADRRSVRVALSPEGLAFAAAARARALAQMEGLVRRLGTDDAALFVGLLRRSSEYFEEIRGACPHGKEHHPC